MDSRFEPIIFKTIQALEDLKIVWVVGGSSSLMVHGVDVSPNDFDIIVNPQDLSIVIAALKSWFVSDDEKTFVIESINGEIVPLPINEKYVTSVNYKNLKIPVFSLNYEYNYYKSKDPVIKRKIEQVLFK